MVWFWSGWRDLNSRPPDPQIGGLRRREFASDGPRCRTAALSGYLPRFLGRRPRSGTSIFRCGTTVTYDSFVKTSNFSAGGRHRVAVGSSMSPLLSPKVLGDASSAHPGP